MTSRPMEKACPGCRSAVPVDSFRWLDGSMRDDVVPEGGHCSSCGRRWRWDCEDGGVVGYFPAGMRWFQEVDFVRTDGCLVVMDSEVAGE